MKRLVVIVEPGDCWQCPLCYDGLECRAMDSRDVGWHKPDPMVMRPLANGSVTPTSIAPCDPYSERPDWCPLDAGVVELRRG